MIKTGNSNVLERTSVENRDTSYEANSSSLTGRNSFTGEYSVSNDLLNMNGYAERGMAFEKGLTEETVSSDFMKEDNSAISATPSITTMQFSVGEENFEAEDEIAEQKSYRLSARGKIMITVYALVVATIIALIAMNAHVLRAMEQNIQDKEAAVEELKARAEQLSDELEYVSSNEVIEQKAVEMGMVK